MLKYIILTATVVVSLSACAPTMDPQAPTDPDSSVSTEPTPQAQEQKNTVPTNVSTSAEEDLLAAAALLADAAEKGIAKVRAQIKEAGLNVDATQTPMGVCLSSESSSILFGQNTKKVAIATFDNNTCTGKSSKNFVVNKSKIERKVKKVSQEAQEAGESAWAYVQDQWLASKN